MLLMTVMMSVRKLCRHQVKKVMHRTCMSQTNGKSDGLLDYYVKLRDILTNKDTLVNHLCQNVVFEDDHLVAINKPAGLPMKAEKTSHIDARLIDNFSLYQVIEDLRHHFSSPDMNLALPLPRNHSGIVVFGKNQVITKSIADKFYLAYGNKQLHQQFHLLCIGNPENLLEEIKQIFLKKKEIQGKLESIEVNKLSVNERKKGQGVMCTYKIKTLSKRLKCGYVELMTNTSRWDCCELLMTQNLAPILGDNTYSNRVALLLGQLVCVDPELADKGPQKLPTEVTDQLGISTENMLKMPLHLHRSRVDLLKFPTKKSEQMTFCANLPEYFKTTLELLKLDVT
ncbi:mitochondrial mRNA pseudouridine synthase RPUSD3-like [Mytilus edulis]|uniref:mitochondrial mRNA pseudouridine synthase RPUSD3-like n=1 Tax=Mytilus edulis TaxID=6550 RepID=UPI0039F0FA40